MDYRPQFSRSRTNSMDYSRIARDRLYMDRPDHDGHLKERTTNTYPSRDRSNRDSHSKGQRTENEKRRRYDEKNRDSSGRGEKHSRDQNRDRGFDGGSVPPPRERRDRSLSPYSKRMALTQAMNIGR